MGIYQGGILGPVSGRVGAVVARRWKNKEVLAARPRKKRSKANVSQKVLAHRARFSYAANFLRAMTDVLAISFPEYTANISARNAALAALIKEAISGGYPDFTLRYEAVKVARGTIGKPYNPAAGTTEPGKIHFTWNDNTGAGTASKAEDKALLIAYCPELDICMFSNTFLRPQAQGVLDVRFMAGKQVHAWMAFTNAEGKKASDSLYLGAKTVLV